VNHPQKPHAGVPGSDRQTAEVDLAAFRTPACKALIELDKLLERWIGKKLSARPYWPLLLRLYLADAEGRTLFQSSLSIDSALANAHRRSARLAELGTVKREPARGDHRRVDLHLTPATREMIEKALDAAVVLYRAVSGQLLADPSTSTPLIPNGAIWYHSSHSTDNEIGPMNVLRGRIIAGGRVALPAEIRRALGLQNGDTVLFEMQGDEVRIRPARSALRRVQERLREFAPQEGLVSDELIAERRAEASRD